MVGELRRSIGHLPAPTAAYTAPNAEFEIYRAKDLLSKKWNSLVHQKLVSLARSAYRRYGKRPLFDKYDAKAAIYLVCARYRIRGFSEPVEEWLSVRIVPGDGKPTGVGEPEIHEAQGKTIDHWMRKKIGAHGFWKRVASSSRMCGIHPYSRDKNGSPVFLKDQRHRHTAVSFSLIHKQFAADYPLARFPYRYFTATIRPDFYKDRLAYISRGRTVRPVHTPAHKFLGMRRTEIRVNRDIYSYPFPLYWLHKGKLLRLVNRLRRKDHKKPISELESRMLVGLVKTGKKPVAIAGFRIEPEKMRRLIDKFVPDVPELKITDNASWYRGMDSVLRAAKVAPKGGHIQLRGNSSKIK